MNSNTKNHLEQLALEIKQIGKELGFNHIGITDVNFTQEIPHFKTWLKSGYHGTMRYFEKHADIYEHPQKLFSPKEARVICCSISYPKAKSITHPIASFAKTQDYSSHIRQILKHYVNRISKKTNVSPKTRIFAGNAPILEKALAAKAGLGWYGKNSILLNHNFGSYFFLGEILIDLPLPIDRPLKNRCGNCFKCQDHCPTKAILAPHKIDASRCIAYLTIEHKDSIPLELRPLMGNKVFGCDLCQQVCPWNKETHNQTITKFSPLNEFIENDLVRWFLWDEKEFKYKTKNSPINRIGHECWLRNISVALGNSPCSSETLKALKSRLNHSSSLVREHVKWALHILKPF